MRAARERIATSPIQSPREDTTWASHSRKNDEDPSNRGPDSSSSGGRSRKAVMGAVARSSSGGISSPRNGWGRLRRDHPHDG